MHLSQKQKSKIMTAQQTRDYAKQIEKHIAEMENSINDETPEIIRFHEKVKVYIQQYYGIIPRSVDFNNYGKNSMTINTAELSDGAVKYLTKQGYTVENDPHYSGGIMYLVSWDYISISK
jgi:hypothetical protein